MSRPVSPHPHASTRFLLCHLSGSPGPYKELAFLKEGLELRGVDARIVTPHPEHLARYANKPPGHAVTPGQALKLSDDGLPTTVLFYSNSLDNLGLLSAFRNRGAAIAFAAHEPRKVHQGVTFAYRARRFVAEAVQDIVASRSDFWIVFSPNGRSLCQVRADAMGKALVELALYQEDFCDLQTLLASAPARSWICLAGRPGGTTGHEAWPELARAMKGIAPDLQPVLLHAGSEGGAHWLGADDLQRMGVIENAAVIRDEDIRAVFSRSLAVVRLDRSCTQSGTTPVAYMCGAPVIGRDIPGLTQHIRDGLTGFIVRDFADEARLAAIVAALRASPVTFVEETRRYFTEIWGRQPRAEGIERLLDAGKTAPQRRRPSA